MPPHDPPAEALDAPPARILAEATPSSPADADELALAEARAEAARARANRLRQIADEASRDPEITQDVDTSRPGRRRSLRPSPKLAYAAGALLAACTALSASGFLEWRHHEVVQQRQRTAAFANAARDGVLAMMSLDPGKARDELQRFADGTTGMFKAGLLMGADDAVKALQQSNVSSKGAVRAVAVESMTADSAVVLVAAKSEFDRPGLPKPDSRSLRLVVTVQRDAGQLKISRLEFVP